MIDCGLKPEGDQPGADSSDADLRVAEDALHRLTDTTDPEEIHDAVVAAFEQGTYQSWPSVLVAVRNLHTDPDTLAFIASRIAEVPHEFGVGYWLGRNPYVRADGLWMLFETLAVLGDRETEMASMAMNPNAPEGILRALLDRHDMTSEPGTAVIGGLALNPSTPPDLLRQIVAEGNAHPGVDFFYANIVHNPRTPRDVLIDLVGTGRGQGDHGHLPRVFIQAGHR